MILDRRGKDANAISTWFGAADLRRPKKQSVENTMNLLLVKFLSALVMLNSLSASVTAQAAAKRAPKLYVTQKFGLMLKVPPGTSFCSLPKDWSGLEEGTVLFLKKPPACLLPGQSSVIRPIKGFVPSITLRYQVNRSRHDAYDGAIPKPTTSEEFAKQFCAGPFVSPDLKLFEPRAFTCRAELPGNKVQIALLAVFDSARSNLVLTLLTTPDRLTNDTRMLASLASSITPCQVSSGKEGPKAPLCPKGKWW